MVFLRCSSGFCFYQLSLLFRLTDGVVRQSAKAPPDISAISALTAVKHGNCSSLTPLLNPVRTRKSLIWPEWRWMPGNCPHYGRWPQHGFTSLKKLRPQSVTSRIQPGSDVIVCAEMDEQWGYVGAKSRQRWLFYAYDRIRRTVVAHVFGERHSGHDWSVF